jgi:hypothetical protein
MLRESVVIIGHSQHQWSDMPNLYIFVVCEKVIVDKSEVASLISLFTTMSVAKPLGSPPREIPTNAVVPKEWAVFSSWDWDDADDGREYTQRIEVLFPDHTLFVKLEQKLLMISRRRIQTIAPISGFPIGQQGFYTVRLWLELDGVSICEPRPIIIEVKHVAEGQLT